MLRVEILQPTRRELRPFVQLPFDLYKNDPNWTPPLLRDQYQCLLGRDNELFAQGVQRFFLAYEGDTPVARVLAGIDYKRNNESGEKCGYISLFESDENIDHAAAVLDAAAAFLREYGMERVTGPLPPRFSPWSRGLLIEGFDSRPAMLGAYNPPCYPRFLEACGYAKKRDYYAFLLEMKDFRAERFEPIVTRAQKRFGFRVEPLVLTPKTLPRVTRDLMRLSEHPVGEWSTYLPTEQSVRQMLAALCPFHNSELSAMAYAGDRPIGVLLGLPDFSRVLRNMHGRIFPMGAFYSLFSGRYTDGVRYSIQYVAPEYQNMAVNAVMCYRVFLAARRMGFAWAEGSLVDETNVQSINNVEQVASRRVRTYRQYEKTL